MWNCAFMEELQYRRREIPLQIHYLVCWQRKNPNGRRNCIKTNNDSVQLGLRSAAKWIQLFNLALCLIVGKKLESFCRRKTAEDDNAKINVFPNILCTFLLFKSSACLQILFPIKSKFWERQFFLAVNVWHTYLFL